MKSNIVAGTGVIVGIIQLILHFLGILGLLGGVIALVAGNSSRGWELIIGGLIFLVIKYTLGFLFMATGTIVSSKASTPNTNPGDSRYDQLITTLNAIKHGTASKQQKKLISAKLISNAQLTETEQQDLLSQLEEAYNASDEN